MAILEPANKEGLSIILLASKAEDCWAIEEGARGLSLDPIEEEDTEGVEEKELGRPALTCWAAMA